MNPALPPGPPKVAAKPAQREAIWFRFGAALVIPFALLLALEGILRLAGYGYSTSFFRTREFQGHAVWTDNPDFGRRFFPTGLARRSQPFIVPVAKPTNTLRILVLGESAAMGDPDFKFGLPRLLEVLFRERFPQRHIEVINAAMVAINSHVVLSIAGDSVKRQADLWVIYMGNNEMVGPFGSESIFGARSPGLGVIRASLWLKQLRLVQCLDSGLNRLTRKPSEWSGMEMMAGQKARYHSPATEQVYANFRRNLADLLATAGRAGVPVVLCTVATNLKDCAPFASLHRPGLIQQELSDWQAAYDAGCSNEKRGNRVEAKAAFERAATIDSEHADLSFHLAECWRSLGQNTKAAELFQHARDQDALQFRADSRINELIREAGKAFAERNIKLLEVEKSFATNSSDGLIGADYFYEHVHLTPEGNYLLARLVAEASAQALGLSVDRPWVSPVECLRLAGLTDWNRFDALNTILDRIQRAPFTNQSNHSRQLDRLKEQFSHYFAATKPAQARIEAAQVAQQMARFPNDPDLRWNLAVLLQSSGDAAAAETQWRSLRQLQPFSALPPYNLGKLLEATRPSEAIALYQEALKLEPDNALAQEALRNASLREH